MLLTQSLLCNYLLNKLVLNIPINIIQQSNLFPSTDLYNMHFILYTYKH